MNELIGFRIEWSLGPQIAFLQLIGQFFNLLDEVLLLRSFEFLMFNLVDFILIRFHSIKEMLDIFCKFSFVNPFNFNLTQL